MSSLLLQRSAGYGADEKQENVWFNVKWRCNDNDAGSSLSSWVHSLEQSAEKKESLDAATSIESSLQALAP